MSDLKATGYLGDVPLTPEEVREVWLLQQGPWSQEAEDRVIAIKRAAAERLKGREES